MEIIYPTWKDVESVCKKLSKIIAEEYNPEILIGIARGGLVPLRLFSDYLDNSNVETIRLEYYTGIGETREKPKITEPLRTEIKGKKVLLIDDISDSGSSLHKAVAYLEKFKPKELKVVTLHYKPDSGLKPDYFGGTTNAWIVYPWEFEEFKRLEGMK